VHMYQKNGYHTGKAILFTDSIFGQSEVDIKFLQNSILFNDLFSVSKILVSHSATEFEQILNLMQNEADFGKEIYHPNILKNYLHTFLLLAERERRKQDFIEVKKGADLDYLMLFKDILEEQYRNNRQVNAYAAQLSVTEKRLNLATTKILGKTPKQMIDERIMLEAKRLLAHTTDSIKEIGYYLGFDEPTNFIKYFKKHQHETPVEFREHVFPS
ncbi:MAG: helix-turn-helix domain-containing protein, partial [Flavobacterium sp.]